MVTDSWVRKEEYRCSLRCNLWDAAKENIEQQIGQTWCSCFKFLQRWISILKGSRSAMSLQKTKKNMTNHVHNMFAKNEFISALAKATLLPWSNCQRVRGLNPTNQWSEYIRIILMKSFLKKKVIWKTLFNSQKIILIFLKITVTDGMIFLLWSKRRNKKTNDQEEKKKTQKKTGVDTWWNMGGRGRGGGEKGKKSYRRPFPLNSEKVSTMPF